MRTVLSVDTMGERDPQGNPIMILKVDISPFANPEGAKPRFFKLMPSQLPGWNGANSVVQRGRILRDELKKHPGVNQAFALLAAAPVGDLKPVFIKLCPGDVELLSWETLCDHNDRFLALDRRWPIGRISPPQNNHGRLPAAFNGKVRMMAIISALGIAGQEREWKNIYVSAKALRKRLDVKLRVLSSEPATRAEVTAAIAAGENWLELGPIETPSRVLQDIAGWAPNILHFFSHGFANEERQFVHLGTMADFVNGDDLQNRIDAEGSVKIPIGLLEDLAGQLTNPWLLVLNACLTAAAAHEVQSIAHGVVAAGFPAAVAMTEKVDAVDAFEFTRAFYNSLFPRLAAVEDQFKHGPTVSFEWAEALYDARTAISDRHAEAGPESSREWALPVLYVSGTAPMNFVKLVDEAVEPGVAVADVFEGGAGAGVTVVKADSAEVNRDEAKQKAKIMAEWLGYMRDKMSEAEREEAIKTVLMDVPQAYWPSPDGSFPNG